MIFGLRILLFLSVNTDDTEMINLVDGDFLAQNHSEELFPYKIYY